MDFGAFRADTERDMKLIMQQNKEMSEELEKTTCRLEQVEHRVGESLDTEVAHHKAIKYLMDKIVDMEERTEYLENKSRQNNVRIFNVPEKCEGSDMVAFLKKFFQETLHLTQDIDVTRAHRLYNESKAHGRPIIAAFRDFDSKKKVIAAAWKRKEIIYNGVRIFFEHDFTPRVHQQRASYRLIRKQLKDKNIKSHVLVPAKLKVFYEDGTAQIFDSLQAATNGLEERGLIVGPSMEQASTAELHQASRPSETFSKQPWKTSKTKTTVEEMDKLMLRAEKNLGLCE